MVYDKKKLNDMIINQINKLLTEMDADYKDLARVLDYSDNSYAFRILKGEKIINITTLVKITSALRLINEKNGKKVDDSHLFLSYIFSQLNL